MWKEGKQIQVADQATTYQNVQLLNGEVTGKHYVSEDPSSMRNREWTSQILPICCLSLVKFIVGHELTCTCRAATGEALAAQHESRSAGGCGKQLPVPGWASQHLCMDTQQVPQHHGSWQQQGRPRQESQRPVQGHEAKPCQLTDLRVQKQLIQAEQDNTMEVVWELAEPVSAKTQSSSPLERMPGGLLEGHQ